ncbi:MAG: hypothetical protein C4524_02650 [Candidatus Zixiibacteriota bacterium]|nr:MAG: hypothetical protein C4524_02650 [candidate division Zixibacteria bacterium]
MVAGLWLLALSCWLSAIGCGGVVPIMECGSLLPLSLPPGLKRSGSWRPLVRITGSTDETDYADFGPPLRGDNKEEGASLPPG